RGPRTRPLILELGPCAATVYGTVVDGDGAPIAGAHVAFTEDRVPVEVDDEGGYELCRAEGQAYLEATAAGYGGVGASVKAAAGRTRLDFTLGAEAVALGRVLRTEDGEPVAGAWVHAHAVGIQTENSAGADGLTDAAGRFRLAG